MRDFAAGACDFHSDYASDFRDFPGDFPGDFGGAPRTAKQPPETPETAPPEQWAATDKATREQGRRQTGSAPRKRQDTEQGKTPRNKAINNGHRASGTAAV